jgi:hypothetical protein
LVAGFASSAELAGEASSLCVSAEPDRDFEVDLEVDGRFARDFAAFDDEEDADCAVGLLSEMAMELMQKRRPVGGGPSANTCPR